MLIGNNMAVLHLCWVRVRATYPITCLWMDEYPVSMVISYIPGVPVSYLEFLTVSYLEFLTVSYLEFLTAFCYIDSIVMLVCVCYQKMGRW